MVWRVIFRSVRWLLRWGLRALLVLGLIVLAMRFVAPPTTPLMASEARRLGGAERVWVNFEDLPPHVMDALVAAEDANFCRHWGFDWAAIRAAWEDGAGRGGSGISQQTAKNVFLWPGRSWLRKGLEAGFTGMIELLWGKRRIAEMYVNVIEFGPGTFGIEAGAQRAFGRAAADLSAGQAARLATVLPNPRERSAVDLNAAQARRIKTIEAGARSIGGDDRGACYRS